MTKEAIEEVYIKQNKSLRHAANYFKCCVRTIVNYLDRYEIPHRKPGDVIQSRKGIKFTEEHKRKISEAQKGKPKKFNTKNGKSPSYTKQEVPCDCCGKPVLVVKHRMKECKHHYCNHICLGKHKTKYKLDGLKDDKGRIKTNCSYCNKEIYKHAYRLVRSKNLFCDIKCHGKWLAENRAGKNSSTYKGGRNYYGESWGRAKILARERDNYSCKKCGKTKDEIGKNPDVHHIIPFRQFGEINHKSANNLNNLISCCPPCHKILERESQKNVILEDYSI